MEKTINYILQGFGFENWMDFIRSSFGFISFKIGVFASLLAGGVVTKSEYLFGVEFMFLIAYVALILLEWASGVLASRSKGEPHKSRKLGRMIFKVFTYTLLLFILNQFARTTDFGGVIGFDLNPFVWLYWIMVFIIIWQMVVSLLENFEQLGWRWASIALKVINKKVNDKLELNEGSNTTGSKSD